MTKNPAGIMNIKLPTNVRVMSLASVFLLGIFPIVSVHSISVSNAPAPSSVGQSAVEAKRISLDFKPNSSGTCNVRGSLLGEVVLTGSAPVEYFVVQQAGSISGPWQAKLGKNSEGEHVARINRQIGPLRRSSVVRVVLNGVAGKRTSDWITIRAKCS